MPPPAASKRRLSLKKRFGQQLETISGSKKKPRNVWDVKKAAVGVRDYFKEKIKHNKKAIQYRAQKKRLGPENRTPSQAEWADESDTPLHAFKNIVAAVTFNIDRCESEFPWTLDEFVDFIDLFKQGKVLRPPTPTDKENFDPNTTMGEFRFGRNKILMTITPDSKKNPALAQLQASQLPIVQGRELLASLSSNPILKPPTVFHKSNVDLNSQVVSAAEGIDLDFWNA